MTQPFHESDARGRSHWNGGKVIETVISVLIASFLTTLMTAQVTKYQIEQAMKKNDEQDARFVELTKEVVELQKQTVSISRDLASAQRQSEEQQRQLIELMKSKR